jgi:hypothetical protein
MTPVPCTPGYVLVTKYKLPVTSLHDYTCHACCSCILYSLCAHFMLPVTTILPHAKCYMQHMPQGVRPQDRPPTLMAARGPRPPSPPCPASRTQQQLFQQRSSLLPAGDAARMNMHALHMQPSTTSPPLPDLNMNGELINFSYKWGI